MDFIKRQLQSPGTIRTLGRTLVRGAVNFLATSLTVTCSIGCFVVPDSDPTESIPFSTEPTSAANCVVSSLSSRPFVYRCTVTVPGTDTPSDLFATIVRDCSIPEKFTTQATTRQLLIGLTDITVVKQSGVDIATHRALLSLVRAQLDATPVALATITRREQVTSGVACISDLIVWRSWEENLNLATLEQGALTLAASSHFLMEDEL